MREYPLPIDTVVKPWGIIRAVLLTGGERYYMMNKGGDVSFMPASVVEPAVQVSERHE